MEKEKNINESVMLEVGHTLQMEKYRVEAHLSSGGFGNTYMVTNTQFEERRAMKEFFMKGINERDDNCTTVSVSNMANRSQFDAQREKFKKEARRLRKLSHPGIVRVDDLFDENGTAYYVMDYIGGGSLSERIKKKGPFSEAQVLKLLPPLLDALEYVHGQHMWHLDLKPGNILLKDEGHPVLIDFGASKQLGLSGGNSTSTGMTYTPGYAPSEQVDQNFDRIGPWTDLYALGGTLYNLLTAETPPSVSEIQESEIGAFDFPKGVSQQTRRLIVWMMNPNRRKRPQSVAEVRTFLKNPPSEADKSESDDTVLGVNKENESKSESSSLSLWQRLSSMQKMGAAGAIALILLLVFILWPKAKPDTPNPPQPTEVTSKSFTSSLGQYAYTGPVDADGQPDGIGKAVFSDGRSYKGPFMHGKFHGTDATFLFANGDTFIGEFREDRFYSGRYTVADDGSYFDGSFTDGQPDKGTWYDKNNKKLE